MHHSRERSAGDACRRPKDKTRVAKLRAANGYVTTKMENTNGLVSAAKRQETKKTTESKKTRENQKKTIFQRSWGWGVPAKSLRIFFLFFSMFFWFSAQKCKNLDKTKKNPEVLGMGVPAKSLRILFFFLVFSCFFCV